MTFATSQMQIKSNIIGAMIGGNGERAYEESYFFRFPRDDFWIRTIVKDCEFAKFVNGKTTYTTSDLQLLNDNNRFFSMQGNFKIDFCADDSFRFIKGLYGEIVNSIVDREAIAVACERDAVGDF